MTNSSSSPATQDGLTADQQQQLFNLRIKQIEEKHALELQVIRSSMKQGGEQTEPEGKLKPEILKVSKSLPGIPRIFLLYILDAKFDPYNLYKLRAVYSDDSNDK